MKTSSLLSSEALVTAHTSKRSVVSHKKAVHIAISKISTWWSTVWINNNIRGHFKKDAEQQSKLFKAPKKRIKVALIVTGVVALLSIVLAAYAFKQASVIIMVTELLIAFCAVYYSLRTKYSKTTLRMIEQWEETKEVFQNCDSFHKLVEMIKSDHHVNTKKEKSKPRFYFEKFQGELVAELTKLSLSINQSKANGDRHQEIEDRTKFASLFKFAKEIGVLEPKDTQERFFHED